MREHLVRCLLMGGQACVLYGAAEFSRDADFAILASEANAVRLRTVMENLRAEVIDVPPICDLLSLPDPIQTRKLSATRTGP